MSTITKGYSFGQTELVTNTKLHSLVDDGAVTAIVNADIGASAAIVGSKLNLAAAGAIGGTTPSTGAFTTLSGTSLVATTADINAGTFDGIVGGTTPAAGAFTTLTATGDIYTNAWADYSATSTVVGWVSFTTKSIYTKKIGKTVFVSYSIAGTSNAATASFTVPYTIASPNFYSVSGYASDAGGTPVAGNIVVVAGGVVIDLRKDATTNAAWTASGTKTVLGRFSYESA